LTKEFKQRIDCLQSKAKHLLKQGLDFPFEKRIETTDRLLTMQGHKIVEATVIFLPFEKRIETTERLLQRNSNKNVEPTLPFPI